MKSDIKDLTEGSLWSGILFFSIPLILSNLLQILFNMSDIAVIGRFAGPAALGSVGSTTTLVMMFTGFLMGMGGGVNVLTARFFGHQGKRKKAVRIRHGRQSRGGARAAGDRPQHPHPGMERTVRIF